jgi:hypothetical protein
MVVELHSICFVIPVTRLAMSLVLIGVISACGDDSTATEAVTSPAISGTPAPATGTTEPLAVTTGEIPLRLDTTEWVLPAAVCLASAGDRDALALAARDAAARVHALVADHATGWPTTTAPLPGGNETYLGELYRDGPLALALGSLAGIDGEIVDHWTAFEQGYAEPNGEWGPTQEISSRLDAWRFTAGRILEAVARPGFCEPA